jgi:hypothetical protein
MAKFPSPLQHKDTSRPVLSRPGRAELVYARHQISPGSKWTVEVRTTNQGEIYCEECGNEDKQHCGTCSASSPIPRFIRIREVTFLGVNEKLVAVNCTCIHNDGYPHRHITFLVNVDCNHFINRHQGQFIVIMNTKINNPLFQHYSRRALDHRFFLPISKCRVEAEQSQTFRTRQGANFWNIEKTQPLQRTKTGMIPHQVAGVDPLIDTPRPTYNGGNFIQELHVPEGRWTLRWTKLCRQFVETFTVI